MQYTALLTLAILFATTLPAQTWWLEAGTRSDFGAREVTISGVVSRVDRFPVTPQIGASLAWKKFSVGLSTGVRVQERFFPCVDDGGPGFKTAG